MRPSGVKPYLYLAPALLFSGIVVLYPIVQVVFYSFSDWKGMDSTFTGTLKNYQSIFHDRIFWQVILNNAKVLLNVPVQIAIAVCCPPCSSRELPGGASTRWSISCRQSSRSSWWVSSGHSSCASTGR